MKIKVMAQPKAGSTSVQGNPVKDGDVLNLRHNG
jgi:hypothetical protein